MSSRRRAHWRRTIGLIAGVVAVLLLAAPPDASGQSTTTLYLRQGGLPTSTMGPNPPGGPLKNLDASRNSDPGLTLERSSAGSAETDPTKYQQFWADALELSLDGPATLSITAASDEFADDEAGKLKAYLFDCDAAVTNCSFLATGSVVSDPWSAAGDWETRTISFGNVAHQFESSRTILLKIVVDNDGSDGDMWLAYAAAAYPGTLTLTEGDGSSTTTTQATTTTTLATTTTTLATTTTTQATTTTTLATTTTTSATPTTTLATTTTTGSTTSSSQATTATTAPSGSTTQPSPPTGAGTPPTSPSDSGDSTATSDEDSSGAAADLEAPPVIEDLLISTVGPIAEPPPPEPDAGGGGVMGAIDLILPDSTGTVVVSPLVVLAAMADAMFSTGASISVPAAGAGLTTGLLLVAGGRRRRPAEETA